MKICPEKWISWQEYRGTVYVFHEASKKSYVFSDSARDFWMAALNCGSVEEMTEQLCRKYGEDCRDDIAADLPAFLDELKNYGLIREVL